MVDHPDDFSRIGKLFVDRLGTDAADAQRRLASKRVFFACGPEVTTSPTQQAALLTAANVAVRCFPNGVRAHPSISRAPLLLPWSGRVTLDEALTAMGVSITAEAEADASVIAFGSFTEHRRALQVTYDRWVGAVAPAQDSFRLPEREGCVVAGVLAGALAVAEVFLEFAGITPEASRRRVGQSLWRPELAWTDGESAGPLVEHLPGEWWSLGLGHLGQAYLWTIGLLSFASPRAVNIVLNDHDTVVPANVGTGMLTTTADVGRLKTRVAARWLEARGFRPRLVERRFDGGTRRYDDEPALALGGFDGSGPRGDLDEAGFKLVIDAGLGGRADDFDTVRLHTLPHPRRTSRELWPAKSEAAASSGVIEDLIERTPMYRQGRDRPGCGHLYLELAGRSVAVPFVGAVASSLVVAEALRLFHGGARYETLTLSLEAGRAPLAQPLVTGKRSRISSTPVVSPDANCSASCGTAAAGNTATTVSPIG